MIEIPKISVDLYPHKTNENYDVKHAVKLIQLSINIEKISMQSRTNSTSLENKIWCMTKYKLELNDK